jgi:hypothetical protein
MRRDERECSDLPVLLTASINPKRAMISVGRASLETRLADYVKALKLWLANPEVTSLIFCDNSGHDLSAIEEICQEQNPFGIKVELLSFSGNDYPGPWGKGYGELAIIGHALANARSIMPASRIVKVTGRYYVRNIGCIMREIRVRQGVDVFCDLRNNLTWGESRVFCASPEFFRTFLLPLLPSVNESEDVLFEHALSRAVHCCMAEGRRWSLLPQAPIIEGVDGTTGVPVANSRVSIIRRRLFRDLKETVFSRK